MSNPKHPFIQSLEKVVIDPCHFTPKEVLSHRGHQQICIKEDGDDASLKQLNILEIDSAMDFCFTLDYQPKNAKDNHYHQYSLYIKDSNTGYNQRCDFIFVHCEPSDIAVYFCDLKSTNLQPKRILKKLRASQLFFDYIKNISDFSNIWEGCNDPSFAYKPYYVVIYDGKQTFHDGEQSPIMKNTANPKKDNSTFYNHKKLSLLKYPLKVKNDGSASIKLIDLISRYVNHKRYGD